MRIYYSIFHNYSLIYATRNIVPKGDKNFSSVYIETEPTNVFISLTVNLSIIIMLTNKALTALERSCN